MLGRKKLGGTPGDSGDSEKKGRVTNHMQRKQDEQYKDSRETLKRGNLVQSRDKARINRSKST